MYSVEEARRDERSPWEIKISYTKGLKREGSLLTGVRKKGPQLICVVSKWQDVKRRQTKTRKKIATRKGRLLFLRVEILNRPAPE